MRNICDMDACTGCLACRDGCPQNAIDFKENEQGFVYPVINEDKCVNCGLCASICPVNSPDKNKKTDKVYACWNKNLSERRAATSGGVFTLLARKVIDNGGVVYGASFRDDMAVCHIRAESIEDIQKLRGSKYVQSNTDGIFKKVKADLDNSKKVLFSGTGCQVSALRNFLRKEYSNLYCVDIVCHGVPSPLVYKDYLKWLESQNDSQIKELSFRYKKPSWNVFSMKADFENGKTYMASKYKDPYLAFF